MFLSLLALSFASEDYAYRPIGKRDPFNGLLWSPPPAPRDLEGWTLRATASAEGGEWAMVEGPDGHHSVLVDGDYLPGTWAKVREIGHEHVLLEEEYLDVLGELVVLRYELELPASR